MGIQTLGIDLYSGLPRSYADQIKRRAKTVSVPRGRVLFRQGDRTSHFYTLVKGQIALIIGHHRNVIHKVEHSGEAFGWSSLMGGDVYTASAVCTADAVALKYDGSQLKALLDGKSAKALRFYLNLSHTLDRRLRRCRGLLSVLADHAKDGADKKGGMKERFDLLS